MIQEDSPWRQTRQTSLISHDIVRALEDQQGTLLPLLARLAHRGKDLRANEALQHLAYADGFRAAYLGQDIGGAMERTRIPPEAHSAFMKGYNVGTDLRNPYDTPLLRLPKDPLEQFPNLNLISLQPQDRSLFKEDTPEINIINFDNPLGLSLPTGRMKRNNERPYNRDF